MKLRSCLVMVSLLMTGAVVAARTRAPWQELPKPPPMPTPDISGMAPINGIRMYYVIYGKGEPILLIHGGLGDSDVWSFQIPGLAAEHEVIVADSRGHGRSTWTGGSITYGLMAQDYLALLDYLKIEKVALVGWSDGGIIGLDMAIHHPDRLTALFAHAANASPDGLIRAPLDRSAIQQSSQRNLADYRRLSSTPDDYPEFAKAIFAMWASEPHFTTKQLASITTPTAIVMGDHDEVVKREHAAYLARTIPGAKLIVLQDVGHFALLQDPPAYTKAILDFLASTASANHSHG